MRLLGGAWRNLRDFFGLAGGATYLWPRWFLLRCIGLVFIIVFAGIIVEGRALIGPAGIAPASEYFHTLRGLFPGAAERLLRAPSLFWLGTGTAAITALEWLGMAAAVALVLNLWPRMALFACWLALLSFVSAWGIFSSTIVDKLMLETALLFIPFAPAGLRPGLGASSPPRPIAVLTVRWLLVRIMFEAGIIKLINGDPRWRDLTAMDVMYETSPLPTFLGYLDHQMPHAYHVFEIALTFTAEIAGPLLAMFCARRWRWFALAAWVAFQSGIQLTTSFGWLNTAALALGAALLDDQMLAAAAQRLRLSRVAGAIAVCTASQTRAACSAWRVYGLRALLGVHFFLGVYFFVAAAMDKTLRSIPSFESRPVDYLFRDFESANAYIPYVSFPRAKLEVEYEGSNDGGRTWRSFEFRYKPQHEDQICRHVAPWFDRFEAGLQLAVNVPQTTVIPRVAALLILRNPDVMALFRGDPFADRPPTLVRMPVYVFIFTDLATYRRTGNYWRKEYVGDYALPIYLNGRGHLVQGPLEGAP
jgi:hypothetical protein